MSIKSNKLTICEGFKTRKNKKITLIIEEDIIEWCFPEPLWGHIKDFVGIFEKVNRIDVPFLRNIAFAVQYETPLWIQKYLNHMSWDPEQRPISEALVASGVLVESFELSNKKLTKQIYNRCLKDPTYCRLQACKWNQELPPRRKGVIYPTRFASYDLEDLWDTSFYHYNKDSLYAKPLGPKITKSQKEERERQIQDEELYQRQAAAKAAADKWLGGRMTVSIAEMKALVQKVEEEDEEVPECFGKHCSNTNNLTIGKCWNRRTQSISDELICPECWEQETNTDCNACKEIFTYDQVKSMPDRWPFLNLLVPNIYCQGCVKDIKERVKRGELTEGDWR